MIFRQLFDNESCTYTYLIAHHQSREALLIDPVVDNVPQYLKLLNELDLRLCYALDTHVHADHITGLGELRRATDCSTIMGEQSRAECLSMKVRNGEPIKVGEICLEAIYTPGHTDDSYSFLLPDRVLTGDTLLIRGTGRTDFQNGDPKAQYDSLFNKLLKLPDDTLVYPAHDYNGMTVSTIGEERRYNPRLQVSTEGEYAQLMNGLKLDNPRMMDVAVPANLACGIRGEI
jgi:sulfur dioxygenase